MEQNLIKCLLDEKDICTDWIENEIYNNETINSEPSSYPSYAVLGFFNDHCLVETKWSTQNNYLECLFLNNSRFFFTEQDIEQLINVVRQIEENNENIVINYKKINCINGDIIVRFRFFFKEEQ